MEEMGDEMYGVLFNVEAGAAGVEVFGMVGIGLVEVEVVCVLTVEVNLRLVGDEEPCVISTPEHFDTGVEELDV